MYSEIHFIFSVGMLILHFSADSAIHF